MGSESANTDDRSDRDVLERAASPREWQPLPNGRLGMLIPCKKRKVYLATDGKTRLCEHGETASAISQYAAGSRVRPVDSLCTCENVDGLTVGRFAKLASRTVLLRCSGRAQRPRGGAAGRPSSAEAANLRRRERGVHAAVRQHPLCPWQFRSDASHDRKTPQWSSSPVQLHAWWQVVAAWPPGHAEDAARFLTKATGVYVIAVVVK